MKLEMLAGTHIAVAIQKATKAARQHSEDVSFDFNGETITVTPRDTDEAVGIAWQERQDARARERRASPAYVREERDRAERTRAAQQKINALLLTFEEAVSGGPFTVLKWLRDFTPPADNVGVLWPRERLMARLATLAPANTNVGRDDLMEPGREEDAALWVIGQAVACMERGMPSMPMTADFASRILARRSN